VTLRETVIEDDDWPGRFAFHRRWNTTARSIPGFSGNATICGRSWKSG